MSLNKWYNVNKAVRVWAGHSEAHKQGWIYAPAAILAIEEYKGSVRFVEWRVEGEGRGAFEVSSGYPETWVFLRDLSLGPYIVVRDEEETPSDPSPTPYPDALDPPPYRVSNEELGAALRTIVNFICRGYSDI